MEFSLASGSLHSILDALPNCFVHSASRLDDASDAWSCVSVTLPSGCTIVDVASPLPPAGVQTDPIAWMFDGEEAEMLNPFTYVVPDPSSCLQSSVPSGDKSKYSFVFTASPASVFPELLMHRYLSSTSVTVLFSGCDSTTSFGLPSTRVYAATISPSDAPDSASVPTGVALTSIAGMF